MACKTLNQGAHNAIISRYGKKLDQLYEDILTNGLRGIDLTIISGLNMHVIISGGNIGKAIFHTAVELDLVNTLE